VLFEEIQYKRGNPSITENESRAYIPEEKKNRA